MCWKSRNATVACRTMASSTPDGSVNYDMTDSNSRGWIVCGKQNEAQSNVSSETSLHAARERARSTETEGSLLGITRTVAGDSGLNTEASTTAMAFEQEMQQEKVMEKPAETRNVAGDPGLNTEASTAAMAFQQEMQQEKVEEKPTELGSGTGPGGTFSHRDVPKKVKPPLARWQNSTFEITLDTRRSWFDSHQNYKRSKVRSSNRRLLSNGKLLQEMKGINALQLDSVRSEFHSKFPGSYIATLDELRQTTFPPRRSEASKIEPEDVKSVSCSSDASSVAARQLMKFVCDCDSSEDIEIGGSAPSCSSLELNGVCSNESVGSTSSVA